MGSTGKEKKFESERRRGLRGLGYKIHHDDADLLEISKNGLLFRVRHERPTNLGDAGKVVNITAMRAFGDEATIMIWDQGEITFPQEADDETGDYIETEDDGVNDRLRADAKACINGLLHQLN